MGLQIINLPAPVAMLLASLIGALATIAASLINLRSVWRKEVQARERRQPVTKKTRRGPIAAVLVLLTASAVGGFALAQYLNAAGKRQALSAQDDLRSRIDQLSAAIHQLEQRDAGSPQAKAAPQEGGLSAIGAATLGPCTAAGCSEKSAEQLTLCASIPATAAVSGVELYARSDDTSGPWNDSRAESDQALDGGRFVGRYFERLDGDAGKQVCQEFRQWDAVHGRNLRMIVNYTLPTATTQSNGP